MFLYFLKYLYFTIVKIHSTTLMGKAQAWNFLILFFFSFEIWGPFKHLARIRKFIRTAQIHADPDPKHWKTPSEKCRPRIEGMHVHYLIYIKNIMTVDI